MQTLTANLLSVPEKIHELQVNYPHSIALSNGERQLSYGELARRSERFAGYLIQLGVEPGDTVAICLERSFDWIVAALGIMRAGAAYVPLDSAWPDARLRFAVQDSGATVLVARTALLDRLQIQARGVDPCRDAAAIDASTEAPRKSIQPESLAYVIYTSGSTGVPKGVEISHANLSNLVRWYCDAFAVNQQDRASHLLGLGFDAAVLEIWAHLSAGATLCLADEGVRSSPELLRQWMVRERVTISLVPAILAARLISLEWPSTTALRLLISGGDMLREGPAADLPFQVVNQYGPTECTVVSTWGAIKPGLVGAPPIGLPVAGASIYLLDEHGKPVLEGETGEIYVGGTIVGRGYRNLPDLTSQYFLRDPFAGKPGALMYRTGDRGSRRPDGQFEFRGRFDRQTKIRGQRLELDEITAVLNEHPSLDFATVIAGLSPEGENELLAYVLPKPNADVPSSRELQKHLLGSLPDYMVPAIFLRLDALPLSPNGKINLNMLPKPQDAQQLEEIASKAPASPIEQKLLSMMREVLRNDRVTAEDSFFLAGGHSLLGMQLLVRLRETFGVELTLRDLFESPTVESLALLVEAMLIEDIDSISEEEAKTQLKSEVDVDFASPFLPMEGHGA
jgi:amino acid adenylation domain-containing protein